MKADAKTEAEVVAVLNKLSDAYAARDVNSVLALFVPDPDVVMIGTGADEKRVGLDQIKVQAERDWTQTEATSLTWGSWQMVGSAGSVAWVAGDATFKVKTGGQNITLSGRMTAVLEKRGSTWLIAQAHFSMPLSEQGAGQSFPTK